MAKMTYYGQFKIDKYLHETFFKDVRGGFFVECGAFDGEFECSCLFFEELLGWKGINIEPLPHIFSRLIKRRPSCININAALSNKKGKALFKQVIHPEFGNYCTNGSLLHAQSHMEELKSVGCSFQDFEVDCLLFNEIIIQHKVEKIDLFVLDVEGHELQALECFQSIPIATLPRVLCVEYPHSGLDNIKTVLGNRYAFNSIHENNAMFVAV